MSHPFIDAANVVLEMYSSRQLASTRVPPDTSSEIHWASEMLLTLAGVAAYAGAPESVVIHAAATQWRVTNQRPELFEALPEGVTL